MFLDRSSILLISTLRRGSVQAAKSRPMGDFLIELIQMKGIRIFLIICIILGVVGVAYSSWLTILSKGAACRLYDELCGLNSGLTFIFATLFFLISSLLIIISAVSWARAQRRLRLEGRGRLGILSQILLALCLAIWVLIAIVAWKFTLG